MPWPINLSSFCSSSSLSYLSDLCVLSDLYVLGLFSSHHLSSPFPSASSLIVPPRQLQGTHDPFPNVMFPLDPSLPGSPLAFSTGEHCLQLQTLNLNSWDFMLTCSIPFSLSSVKFFSSVYKKLMTPGDLLDPLLFPLCLPPSMWMAFTARALTTI